MGVAVIVGSRRVVTTLVVYRAWTVSNWPDIQEDRVRIGTSVGRQMLKEEKLGERIEYTPKPYVHGGAKSLAMY